MEVLRHQCERTGLFTVSAEPKDVQGSDLVQDALRACVCGSVENTGSEVVAVLGPQGCCTLSGATGGPHARLDPGVLDLRDLQFMGVTIPEQGAFAGLVEIVESGSAWPVPAAESALGELSRTRLMFIRKVMWETLPLRLKGMTDRRVACYR